VSNPRSLIECLERSPELGPILVQVIEDVLGLMVGVIYLHEGERAVVRAIGGAGAEAGVRVGDAFPWTDTLCSRMVEGAPPYTRDAPGSPAYRNAPHRAAFGIVTYIGAPIVDEAGAHIGSVCAIDKVSKPVDDRDVEILQALIKSFTRMGAEAAFGARQPIL
jgi:GAF domain-containing protein